MNFEAVERRPGRPKAIPDSLVSEVLLLHKRGLGYRAIARELRRDGVSVDWSSVRRVIKADGKPGYQQR